MAQMPNDWQQYLQPPTVRFQLPGMPLTNVAPALQQGLPPPRVPIAPPTFSGPSQFIPPAPAAAPAAPTATPVAPPGVRPSPFSDPKGFQRALKQELELEEQAESYNAPSYEQPGWIYRQLGVKNPVADMAERGGDSTAKKDMDSYVSMLTQALQPQRTTISIPGGTTLPIPRLPGAPDFGPARRALNESRPVPIPEMGDRENLSSILGAGASAAADAKTVGQLILAAGGGIASQHAKNKGAERLRVDTNNERQREFNRTLANFEVTEAKTKYEADWQRSVIEYQSAMKQWELMQPKVQVTDNGLVVQKKGPSGFEIEFIPNATLGTSALAGKTARKDAGLIGGNAFLKEVQARVAAAPGMGGKQLAIASSIAQHLVRSGQLQLPAASDDDKTKKSTMAWNERLFGEFAPAMPKMLEEAQRRAQTLTTASGLSLSSKEGHEAYLQNFYNMIGATLLTKPVLFNRWFAATFGTTGY